MKIDQASNRDLNDIAGLDGVISRRRRGTKQDRQGRRAEALKEKTATETAFDTAHLPAYSQDFRIITLESGLEATTANMGEGGGIGGIYFWAASLGHVQAHHFG